MLRAGLAIVLFLGVFAVALSLPAGAAPPPALTDGGVSGELDLKGQLEKGLKARRPVEFEYIAQIVAMVEAGTLPRKYVDSTFIYARKTKHRPLQRFQFALDAQVRPLGINVPKLDNQILDFK